MLNLSQAKLSGQSAFYLMLFGTGLLAFVLLGIYPYRRDLTQLEKEINQLSTKIDAQRVFQPYFKALLAQSQRKPPQGLPLPKSSKLGRYDTDRVAATLKDIARFNNLNVQEITLDIDSAVDDTGLLQVAFIVQGRFLDLRPFLIRLAELPYLAHIEQLTIETINGNKRASLQLWLARE